MQTFKHIVNWCVWTLLGLYVLIMIAIHTPWVQRQIGSAMADLIGAKLGTKVSVGRVDLGFLNRVILDDVVLKDQQQRTLLRVGRLTTKIDMAPLAVGRIQVSSAQVFGASLYLSRQTADAPLNAQFVLDSLASKDTTSSSPLNLRINSFILRNSRVTYDQWDVAPTYDRLNPRHLDVTNISAYFILKTLTDDSISVNLKRLTCIEQSGLRLQRLSFLLAAGRHHATLQDFQMQLPDTDIHIDSVSASYDTGRIPESLNIEGMVSRTTITPSDFRWLLPELKKYQRRIAMDARVGYRQQTLTVPALSMLSGEGDLDILANGQVRLPRDGRKTWLLNVDRLELGETTTDFISKNLVELPAPVMRLGTIHARGTASGDEEGRLLANADISTDIGHANTHFLMTADKKFSGTVTTEGLNLRQLLDAPQLEMIAAELQVSGDADRQVAAKGVVSRFDYDGRTYQGIELDGTYSEHHVNGWLQVSDPKLSGLLEADLQATSINDAVGVVSLRNLSLPEKDYSLKYLRLESGFDEDRHFVTLHSDFAHAELRGTVDFATLKQSLANAVGSRLPTLPGLPPLRETTANNFNLRMTVAKTDWIQKLLGVGLDARDPITLSATVNDRSRQMLVDLQAPAFAYNDDDYRKGSVRIASPNDTMTVQAALSSVQDEGRLLDVDIDGFAVDNNLQFALHWNNNSPRKPVSGVLNATTQLYQNFSNKPEAHVRILPSDVVIDNSVWQIEPSDILYSTDRLLVDHFSVHNADQYISIDGTGSSRTSDSLVVSLSNVEVAYILDLINFDAVSFSGKASGKAFLTSAFDNPDANALLEVSNFKFQNGRMGKLHALVEWNKADKQIDLLATCNDGPEAMTYIEGYVSPEREFIDLDISAKGTYLDFMHSFTESFVSHITGHGTGGVRLAGPLSAINLTGGLIVDGEATITPLNTTYRLRQDTLTMVYNKMMLEHQPLYDKYDNVAYLTGAITHEDLTNLCLDLHVATDRLLGYDFHDFGDQSFYGTVFASGDVGIRMKGDDVHIDCNVTPLRNTVFVYNAANPDVISNQEFVTWKTGSHESIATRQEPASSSTNIYMTFLVNATPEATMRLLMDARTNDYITLQGSGIIQATYHNKGAFQMQGTYTVDNGTYDVTIQNIINKKFQFQPGGTIVFGGDPYSAALNLQALYAVNGVSLSDLNIGNSFSSNTVRVNCLMNIAGQPSAPQVTFDLDLPNVNADEKQMVRSLLSSQQEMNQQVLYLLGIGRFYSQGQNNATQQEQQNQTSLAMNSFLSGTLSTQINNVINQIVKNEYWNFGANISTGTEGWNNAEYEGIINGRLLNNRLLINGQFGYRDNATKANPSFIGDFDVRYLLFPNGNLSLKVYNQTNDRYFTRSSLNTQGVGIIMKKNFNTLSDFFGLKNDNR